MKHLLIYLVTINLAFSFSKKSESSSSSSSSSSSVNVREKILNHVAASSCYKKRWRDRGQIPLGFLQGMAINFYKNKDEAVRPLGLSAKDALRYYEIEASKVKFASLFTRLKHYIDCNTLGAFLCGHIKSQASF